MKERLTKRNFLRTTLGTGAMIALSACAPLERFLPKEKSVYETLKDKQGEWTTEEQVRVSRILQESPGANVRENGKWLEALAQNKKHLQDLSSLLLDPLRIQTQDTEKVWAVRTLATTGFSLVQGAISTEITIHPKVFDGSREVISLILAKELQNIKSAAASSLEHRDLVRVQSEQEFWDLLTSQTPRGRDIAIVLMDGRAYWEMMEDYQDTVRKLGGTYSSLKKEDQALLGSFAELERCALVGGALVFKSGRIVPNPKMTISGYTSKAWADCATRLFRPQ